MGRPRKPTALLKFQGDFAPSRHGDRSKEPVANGEPIKPKGLPKYASEHWDFVVPKLVGMGIAKGIDTPALIEMCYWYQKICELRKYKELDYRGLNMAACASKQWKDLVTRFGLSPRDRASLEVDTPATSDPAAEFLA